MPVFSQCEQKIQNSEYLSAESEPEIPTPSTKKPKRSFLRRQTTKTIKSKVRRGAKITK